MSAWRARKKVSAWAARGEGVLMGGGIALFGGVGEGGCQVGLLLNCILNYGYRP